MVIFLDNNPKVLIGIGTCDKFEYCDEHMIKSVLNQTYKNFDILIVDNSFDLTYFSTLMKMNLPAKVIHRPRAKYFRDALMDNRQFIVNHCIAGNYDSLLFIDADHVLELDTLEKLVKHNKDMITGNIGYLHQEFSTCYLQDFDQKKPSKVAGIPPLKAISYKDMEKPPFLMEIIGCGLACALIKTHVLIGIKFQNTHSIKAFMEDLFFCKDLREKNVKIFLDKTVKPMHLHTFIPDREFRQGS